MPVNLPNPGNYFQTLGQHIVDLRDALNALLIDSAYLSAMGGATFLEGPPFNLTSADATAVANLILAVTPTNATVEAIQAFTSQGITITGGQV